MVIRKTARSGKDYQGEMMREILFRGKRIDNGEWVYGDVFHGEQKWIVQRVAKKPVTPIEIFPETIGQFTNLLDKNGNRIFEGDILEITLPRKRQLKGIDGYRIKAKVEYSSGSFWFNGEGYTDCNWHQYNASDREIIGNIHD